jgi:4-hydroxybenzoate polyprenyltransferase
VYLLGVIQIDTITESVLNQIRRIGHYMPDDVRSFIVHFRLHYQVFILSGGYLFGALFYEGIEPGMFWLQFLNVAVLLFGTATVYNSWHDNDDGPIGGLKHPPPMQPWMRKVALWMQFGGLLLAHFAGIEFTYLYLTSMIFFWLYSTRRARWKGHPIKSLIAIGISTGSNSFWMGYFAAGGNTFHVDIIIAGIGTALVFLSLYPVSQIYQMRSDSSRGDRTFAIEFGIQGVKRFYSRSYYIGLVLAGIPFTIFMWQVGLLFLVAGVVTGRIVGAKVGALKGDASEYNDVMKTKYMTSLSFVAFILAALFVIHIVMA